MLIDVDSLTVVAICRYRGFRDENGEYLPEYFHLLAIRLSFVIVFEVSVRHTVMGGKAYWTNVEIEM